MLENYVTRTYVEVNIKVLDDTSLHKCWVTVQNSSGDEPTEKLIPR